MIGGGFETTKLASLLGAEPFVRQLDAPGLSAAGAEDLLKDLIIAVSNRADELAAQFGSGRALVTAFGENTANLLVTAQAIRGNLVQTLTDQERLVATINDSVNSLKGFFLRLLEPVAFIGKLLIDLLDKVGSIGTTFSVAAILTGVTTIFIRGINFLRSVPILLTQIRNFLANPLGPGKAKAPGFFNMTAQQRGANIVGRVTGSSPVKLGKLGTILTTGLGLFTGPFGIIISLLTFLPMIFGSSAKTKDNTKSIDDKLREGDRAPANDSARSLLMNEASLIAKLSRVPDLKGLQFKAEDSRVREEIGKSIFDVVKDIGRTMESIRDKRENNPSFAIRMGLNR